jgi:peptidyl-prolyl cis-trans isomerase C
MVLTLPALSETKAPASPLPAGVVARVNGRPILQRDFDLAVQIQFRGGRSQPVGLEQLHATRDKVLETLIDNELLYQKATKIQVQVTDAEVAAEVERLKKNFATPEDFATALKESGVSEAEFAGQVRRSLVVTRFVKREVIGDLKISDEEIKRYYDQNPSEAKRPEGVRVSQIMVRLAPDASPQERAEARQRIEAIMKELRSGQDFGDLARHYSEGPEAGRGGDSGILTHGGGASPLIERAAFALEPGQTSDILETRIGFHILKVTGRRPEGPIPFEEAKPRIKAKIAVQERRDKLRTYMTALREGAKVEREGPVPPPKR